MKHIFHSTDKNDEQLIKDSLAGSMSALESLIKRHYNFIYNVALRYVLNPDDAQDLTQETIIKIITKLSQFDHRSEFRTWLYRIVFNHFLNIKKKKMEQAVISFEEYGKELDSIPNIALNQEEEIELKEKIEDAKIGCMTGMLLCLDRKQRLVYVLGEIFEIDSKTGATLIDISPDNFRQLLSRARKDLYHFMNDKCGLINTDNPCRCPKKTKGFIRAGWVNESDLRFNNHYISRISAIAMHKSNQCGSLIEEKYGELFKEHPYYNKDKTSKLLNQIINDSEIKKIFNF